MCYVSAVGASWTVAMILHAIVRQGTFLHRLVPFFSATGPQSFNVPLTRRKELEDGIEIFEQEDVSNTEGLGLKSKTAAQWACTMTFGVRALMAMALPGQAQTRRGFPSAAAQSSRPARA